MRRDTNYWLIGRRFLPLLPLHTHSLFSNSRPQQSLFGPAINVRALIDRNRALLMHGSFSSLIYLEAFVRWQIYRTWKNGMTYFGQRTRTTYIFWLGSKNCGTLTAPRRRNIGIHTRILPTYLVPRTLYV